MSKPKTLYVHQKYGSVYEDGSYAPHLSPRLTKEQVENKISKFMVDEYTQKFIPACFIYYMDIMKGNKGKYWGHWDMEHLYGKDM